MNPKIILSIIGFLIVIASGFPVPCGCPEDEGTPPEIPPPVRPEIPPSVDILPLTPLATITILEMNNLPRPLEAPLAVNPPGIPPPVPNAPPLAAPAANHFNFLRMWYQPFLHFFRGFQPPRAETTIQEVPNSGPPSIRRPGHRPPPTLDEIVDTILKISSRGLWWRYYFQVLRLGERTIPNLANALFSQYVRERHRLPMNPFFTETSCIISAHFLQHGILEAFFEGVQTMLYNSRQVPLIDFKRYQPDFEMIIEQLTDNTAMTFEISNPQHIFVVHRVGDHIYLYNSFQDLFTLADWVEEIGEHRYTLSTFVENLRALLSPIDRNTERRVPAFRNLFMIHNGFERIDFTRLVADFSSRQCYLLTVEKVSW